MMLTRCVPAIWRSHYLPLEQAPHGYELFRKKAGGCTKVVLQPGRKGPLVIAGGAGAAMTAPGVSPPR